MQTKNHKNTCINVTLVVEMKDKEFTSHKAKYALQFGTNDNMITDFQINKTKNPIFPTL